MNNIILTRIDNRLVHGQVGVTWCTTLGIDYIIVVDNDTYLDKLQQMLMTTVAKAGHSKICFSKVETFLDDYAKISESARILIVVKSPGICIELIKLGVPITEINLGNIHYEKGKKQYWKKIYLDDNDIIDIRYLLDKGIKIFVQDVPGSSMEKITTI